MNELQGFLWRLSFTSYIKEINPFTQGTLLNTLRVVDLGVLLTLRDFETQNGLRNLDFSFYYNWFFLRIERSPGLCGASVTDRPKISFHYPTCGVGRLFV